MEAAWKGRSGLTAMPFGLNGEPDAAEISPKKASLRCKLLRYNEITLFRLKAENSPVFVTVASPARKNAIVAR